MVRRAVFLDRDGVLTEHSRPPRSASGLAIAAGAREALMELKRAGFLLIVVTNQPDVARGGLRREDVDAVNEALRAALPLDDVLVCPHDDSDGCACRKPRPGMLLEGARRHGLDLAASFMVGDRWKDIDAGSAAGCRTVLIGAGHEAAGAQVTSLAEAVRWILAAPAPRPTPE